MGLVVVAAMLLGNGPPRGLNSQARSELSDAGVDKYGTVAPSGLVFETPEDPGRAWATGPKRGAPIGPRDEGRQ